MDWKKLLLDAIDPIKEMDELVQWAAEHLRRRATQQHYAWLY